MPESDPVTNDGTPIRRIVVGVDGSEPSIRALRWAARQAEWSDAMLEVLTVWTFPEHPAPLGIAIHVPWPDELIAEATTRLDELVRSTLPGFDPQRVDSHVIRGSAVPVLLDAARAAELLVVGSRGRGTMADLLLGSVSERCVRHATCPVVVIR